MFFFYSLIIHKLRQEAWITHRASSSMFPHPPPPKKQTNKKKTRGREREWQKEEVCDYKKLHFNIQVLFQGLSSIVVAVCTAYTK